MPLYFVDFQDGENLHFDPNGSEFDKFEDARKQVIAALKEIATDRPKNNQRHEVIVTIRDESEKAIYKETLKLYGKKRADALLPEVDLRSKQLLDLSFLQKAADNSSRAESDQSGS